jgi:KDO2-lipid IV(A) lauroyltransferase
MHDVFRTFATYASCLAETLSADRWTPPAVTVRGNHHLDRALGEGRGLVVVTAHTAGWEVVGACLARDRNVPVTIVVEAESDALSSTIQDGARAAHGVGIVHAGRDPLSVLPLIHHIRRGGVVALQMDRVPVGMSTIDVKLFGVSSTIPAGPVRLAALTGAPIVPAFASRRGFRSYEVWVGEAVRLNRLPDPVEVSLAAQHLALAMEQFVQSHPTQWFHFVSSE